MTPNLFIALGMVSIVSTQALAFDAKFADDTWDGIKVPAGQQCQKFGGQNPATPPLIIKGIPAGSNAIVLEYSDGDYAPMDKGGHGRISFMLDSSANEVTVPSVAGHTFDLPAAFKVLEAHRNPDWDTAGAYMPPCSGGKGHAYYVTLKATQDDKVMATTTLQMGTF